MEDRAVMVEASTRRMVAGFDAMARADWLEAAGHFRGAAESRELLPWAADGESAWMLAAAWLNHGDVLLRIGDPDLLDDALRSIDRTIEAMGVVDLSRNPAFPERLILAWLHRATTQCEMGDATGSLKDFAKGEELLEQWGESATPVRCFLAAMLRVNRARVWILAGQPLEAWSEAKAGISRLQPINLTSETAAAGIQARSVQCRALAMLLDEPGGSEKMGDWIAEATDSAEQALALVRATGFRDHWVSDLVRYGAMIYRACQPHFLGEFLVEWLGEGGPLSADLVLRSEMRGVLWLTIADTERKVLSAPHETEFVEKQTRVLAALQQGLARLGRVSHFRPLAEQIVIHTGELGGRLMDEWLIRKSAVQTLDGDVHIEQQGSPFIRADHALEPEE